MLFNLMSNIRTKKFVKDHILKNNNVEYGRTYGWPDTIRSYTCFNNIYNTQIYNVQMVSTIMTIVLNSNNGKRGREDQEKGKHACKHRKAPLAHR